MRLLMVTPQLPYPPQSGGALRAYGILRTLHEAGHQVSLLSFDDGKLAGEASLLAALCDAIITLPPPATRSKIARLRHLIASSEADLIQRMESAAMRAKLDELARTGGYDVIQFEGIEMALYLPHARAAGTRAKLIYDAFNAEYALQQMIAQVDAITPRRWLAAVYSRLQAARIYTLERTICQQADEVIAVSPEDAALLQPLRGKPLLMVPSGIFTAEYAHPDDPDAVEVAFDPQMYKVGQIPLLFTGKMDYRPNVDAALWFAESIFPRIHAAQKDARFVIVGQQPIDEVQALTTHDDILVTGKVPDVKPYLHQAAVYVAPLRMGSGTRLKLLEAMAAGCCIVATNVAAAGLDDDSKRAMLITDDETGFANAVLKLLQNPDLRGQLGAQAQRMVKVNYDWAALAARLMEVYERPSMG
jgi:polysaccharide biosynthesis protein PslH